MISTIPPAHNSRPSFQFPNVVHVRNKTQKNRAINQSQQNDITQGLAQANSRVANVIHVHYKLQKNRFKLDQPRQGDISLANKSALSNPDGVAYKI